ncbi:TPA: STM4504/CBY_0614 family protein [Pseudomonas putida]|uniref:STM4504/CBY_0614 family protein n=1 Tax=Pseudomonas putida TaxID=303 RepID=UPI00062A22FA|nr:hypothetical protein [Pseudomonas putida]
MAVIDLYSKRARRARGEFPDVYQYISLPSALKTQIVQIWIEALGNHDDFRRWGKSPHAWSMMTSMLRREYGVFALTSRAAHQDDPIAELCDFFMAENNVEKALDAVELAFRAIDRLTRSWDYLQRSNADEVASEAIAELNTRFREHGVGFEFLSGEIIRKDSQLLHEEVVKPALRLLQQSCYRGPEEEFLLAHSHYRQGNTKEALNECLKAFESMMKAICDKRGWEYADHATASKLIQVLFDHELIPLYWQQSLTSLRSSLESSVPTGRNKLSGHGQGSAPTQVPEHLAAYMLHMTASCLVFLAEAEALYSVSDTQDSRG